MRKLIAIMVIVMAIIAIAWHRLGYGGMPPIKMLCPAANQLVKDPRTAVWKSENNIGAWQSEQASFADTVTHFSGAQWVGARVGQVICVYASERSYTQNGQNFIQQTLPVLLAFNQLIEQPGGKHWISRAQRPGVVNCIEADRRDCPFYVFVQTKAGNILQVAASLKQQAAQQNSPLDGLDGES